MTTESRITLCFKTMHAHVLVRETEERLWPLPNQFWLSSLNTWIEKPLRWHPDKYNLSLFAWDALMRSDSPYSLTQHPVSLLHISYHHQVVNYYSRFLSSCFCLFSPNRFPPFCGRNHILFSIIFSALARWLNQSRQLKSIH